MEASVLNCPSCCDKTFSTKAELVEHLTNILGNVVCPVCSNKLSSVEHLVEHLTLDNCQAEGGESLPAKIIQQANLHTDDESIQENHYEKLESIDMDGENKELDVDFSCSEKIEDTEDGLEMGKMYVELLSKLETKELKLVEDNGVSRYVIVTDDGSEITSGNAVITKQNNDGTISITSVKEMKMETEPALISPDNETEEVYSCNTCGVSFTSVLEHIQNYHNDQDVVVEEPADESNNEVTLEELEEALSNEENSIEKQLPRRMITETGDIIEAPQTIKTTMGLSDTILLTQEDEMGPLQMEYIKNEDVGSPGVPLARRYVRIEKFCDSVVKDINQPDEKNGPYHKVVVKEVQTQDGIKVKAYHCMSCNILVQTLDEFKLHPCKVLKYKCPHCSVAYENSKSLCAHMKVHKVSSDVSLEKVVIETPTSFECEICCTVFLTNKSLKLHKRMHDPVKSRPIELPVDSEHGVDSGKRYLCPLCDKMIPVEYKNVHQASHKHDNKFNCDICNKKFLSSEYLEMHMTVHSIDKVPVNRSDKALPYNCLYCTRQFARPHEKVKHERIHTGEKPHSCEICGKSFRVSYCLTLHMRTHTGARPYACPHCNKRFKAHSVYNHHLLTHSEVRAYKCPYCPKAFKTAVQLAGHKNSHTKPFSCQLCNRPFASLYAVRVHTETHARQNNLKFSCKLCGASYARAFALKDHVKQVHKQDIETENVVTLIETVSETSVKEEDWLENQSINQLASEAAVIQPLSKELPTEVQVQI